MKRGANIQLTHDNPSDEEKVVDSGEFKRATDEILSKRVIKPLKKKSSTSLLQSSASALGATFGSTPISTGSSAFTSSTGSIAGIPFGSTLGTTPFTTTPRPLESKSTINGFSDSSKAIKNINDQKALEIRGLNTSFLNYITKCVKDDCFVDLSKVNLEYNSYLSIIGHDSGKIDLGTLPESSQKLPLTLNFGSKIQETKTSDTPFIFQTPKSNETVSAFSALNSKSNEAPKLAFLSAMKKPETSSFGISNSTKTTEAPAFGFSSATKTTDSPAFGFTSTAKTTEAPAFSFTGATKTTEAPAFGFKTTEAPEFEFSNNAIPTFNFSMPKKDSEAMSPFGFSATNEQKSSAFSPVAVPSFGTLNASSAGLAGTSGIKAAGDENADDGDDDVDHEEQVGDALMSGKAGEEGEVTLYSVKSKLRKFVNGSWEIIGLGLLKVNQNQSTKASRIILRSEAGKVLLNVSIFSGMSITLKETSVNFSASLAAGSLTTISAKVKEKHDATALANVIEKAKPKT